MSLAQPMLEAKEVVHEAKVVHVPTRGHPTEEQHTALIDTKTTSLRRAATALLVLSMACARPWPSAGWLGLIASIAVLCASSNNILCRARVGRIFSAITAIVALISVVYLVASIHAGKPQRVGDEVMAKCADMPSDAFAWAKTIVAEHKCAQQGLAFLSRHTSKRDEAALSTNATDLTNLTASAEHEWSQPEACELASHVAARSVKMMMIGSALAHLLLFLSAVAVVNRACRLRCAAYKAGLLKWKKCGACKRAPTQPAAEATVAP